LSLNIKVRFGHYITTPHAKLSHEILIGMEINFIGMVYAEKKEIGTVYK